MRILQVVQKPQRRGAEIFARTLNAVLERLGHTTRTVYLYPYQGDHRLKCDKQDVLLGGAEKHLLERIPGVHPRLVAGLRSAIRAFQPDIVQANGGRTVKYASIVRRLHSRGHWRLIYQNIDDPRYWLQDPLRRFYYRQIVMPAMDGVVAVSETTLQQVADVYGLCCPMVHIPNGRLFDQLDANLSQEAARAALDVPLTKQVVLCLGNITQQKRPDRFLRIMDALRHRIAELEVWFVGDGDLRAAMESHSAQLGLDQIVRFWGYQSEVSPFLRAADLLAITSDSEGIPGVVLEAGYLGCPVVASDVGGMHECIRHGATGFLVPPADETAFCNALADLLRDKQRRREMGKNAARWIHDHFAMDRCAQHYVDFYQQILRGGRDEATVLGPASCPRNASSVSK